MGRGDGKLVFNANSFNFRKRKIREKDDGESSKTVCMSLNCTVKYG